MLWVVDKLQAGSFGVVWSCLITKSLTTSGLHHPNITKKYAIKMVTANPGFGTQKMTKENWLEDLNIWKITRENPKLIQS